MTTENTGTINRTTAIVFDIDGTLADNSHRQHFLLQNPKDWKSFYRGMGSDKPIDSVRLVCASLMIFEAMATDLMVDPPFRVIFCSGRPDNYRGQTIAWLKKHIYDNAKWPMEIVLYMRKAGDHRPDDVVKEELLGQMRDDGFEPGIVFDDRQRVVDMWRRNGITCCQCAEGNF